MEALENKRNGGAQEEELRFVTGNYAKQLAAQKEHETIVDKEESR